MAKIFLLQSCCENRECPGYVDTINSSTRMVIDCGCSSCWQALIAQRLCGLFQVGFSKAQDILGLRPSVGVDEALKKQR